MMILRLSSMLCAAFVVSCRTPGCIEIEAGVPLLENPYPLNHPGTRPMPNKRLRALDAGEYGYRDVTDGKDFRAYELTLPDGSHGYVILDNGVRDCRDGPGTTMSKAAP